MAKLINLSIDVTKITKSKLITGKKGTYLNITIAVNDEKDNYDNDVSCWEKCEKEETKNYLGNGRVFWTNETPSTQTPQQEKPKDAKDFNEEENDLPF